MPSKPYCDEPLFAAAVVSLPAIAFALGNAVLLERSKETEFCVSCHVMEPIYESLRENDGSLASTHASRGAVPAAQSCYTCHSGYGMQGDMAAKLSGLRHMVHTVTGRYDLPLRISGAYKIESCLACHAEGSAFRGQEAHHDEDIQQALLSGEMGCTGTCHPSAHPDSALTGGSVAE